MWNPPNEDECITFEERSFPHDHPDSLTRKLHGHDTTGDIQWNRKYWIEPRLAADPELHSGALQWGVP
eukprot:4625700-Prorocentrum_lima.AAC.1